MNAHYYHQCYLEYLRIWPILLDKKKGKGICKSFCLSLFKKKKDLFIFRERGKEGEREREKHWCERATSTSCLLHTPNWGPALQPSHVSWLGIEPATFGFGEWCLTHWATRVRAACHSCQWCDILHGKHNTICRQTYQNYKRVINQVCKNRNHLTKTNSVLLYQE